MAKKINLLYVVHNLIIGGGQQLVKLLALNVDRARFNPMVLSLIDYAGKSDVEPLTDEIRDSGVEVFTLYMNKLRGDPERDRFMEIIREKQVDVVHSHIYHTDLWASLMAKEAGVKVILYTKHDTYKNKPMKVRVQNALLYNRSVDMAFSISKTSFRHMWAYEFIFPWKIRMMYNPIDTALFDPAVVKTDLRAEYGIPPDAPVIGSVTRLVAGKGVDNFIRVCDKVSKVLPEAWFLMVGYGAKEDEYKKLASSLNMKNFIFTGSRRDVPQALNTLDVFMFTPVSGEGLPMVMLEAMSMEKAIVASNTCSNPELVTDGVSGLLPTPAKWSLSVEGLDEDALAQAAIRLIKDPGLRERLGGSARQSVRERFDIVPVMRKLEGHYERILRRKGVLHGAR